MTTTNKNSEKQNKTKANEKERVETSKTKTPDLEALSQEQVEIVEWLKKIKFKKKLVGGVKEEDVWSKINQLNEMYEAALKAERIRYDVLLEQQKQDGNITSLKDVDSKEAIPDG